MNQLQNLANEIRDRLLENEAVRRLGIEVLWASGSAESLTVRARHRDRVLTVERTGRWHRRTTEAQASELGHELVADALDTLRAQPAPPRWRIGPADTGPGCARPGSPTRPAASAPAQP
jgi:hypothetical protein